MLITMALIPPLMKSAARLRFIDVPDARKVHLGNIPRVGGIAMVAGAVLPIIMWLMPQQQVIGFLLGMAVIVAFGIWDDRSDLDYRLKFLGQTVAVLIAMFYGGVLIESIPLVSDAERLPSYLSYPLTFLFLLGITNAVNLSDGLDGLAGGTVILSIGTIALLGYTTDNAVVVVIAVAMIGSILGFLRFNTHPAQIFMGDGGSQFLGFSVGVLAVLLTQKGAAPLSPVLPLLILGLPILDTAMVMWQRITSGRSPFAADKNHIHHKLLGLGFSHYEAVLLIYIAQAGMVMSAYFLRHQSDAILLLVFLTVSVVLVGFFRWAALSGWRVRRGDGHAAGYQELQKKIVWLRDEGYPLKIARGIVVTMIATYFLSAVLTAQKITPDIGILAFALAAFMVAVLTRGRNHAITWTDQAGMYVLGTLAVYLAQTSSQVMAHMQPWVEGSFVILAAGVLLGLRYSKYMRFNLTTLDFLVIFAAFTIPNLPNIDIGQTSLGESIAKLIVLFYAIELLMLNMGRLIHVLRIVMMLLFLTIAVKAAV